MGVVFAARHLELDQRVAIKFLEKHATGAVDRFVREARAAARIKSEHVVRIFDVGRDGTSTDPSAASRRGEGAPYIVMEYLDGENLAARLANTGPLAPVFVADFLLQACDALAEAHAMGVVHRDLKPENVFLARGKDGTDCVKLVDFGIAKLPGLGSMTHTTTVMGSPLYMSPEQLTSSRDVDARADIWSLGVILYELLTGQMPFDADSVVQLAVKVREQPFEPLDAACPDAPSELVKAVEGCLEKDQERRFPSVAQLAEKLGCVASPELRHLVGRITRVLAEPARSEDPSSLGRAPTVDSGPREDDGAGGGSATSSRPTLDALSRSLSRPGPRLRWVSFIGFGALLVSGAGATWRFTRGDDAASAAAPATVATVAPSIDPPAPAIEAAGAPPFGAGAAAVAAAAPTVAAVEPARATPKRGPAARQPTAPAASAPVAPPPSSTPPPPAAPAATETVPPQPTSTPRPRRLLDRTEPW